MENLVYKLALLVFLKALDKSYCDPSFSLFEYTPSKAHDLLKFWLFTVQE